MRRVRTLRLSAPDHTLIRRGSLLVEDALRTASLPDTGQLIVVRSLDVGAIQAGHASSSVALLIERSFSKLRSMAVHASSSDAAHARVVYFADALEAHVLLASRLARGAPATEWFWPLAIPAFNRGQPRDEALRAMLFSALQTAAGPAAAVLVFHELRRQGLANPLLSVLRWQDGPALVRALGWSTTDRVQVLRDVATSAPELVTLLPSSDVVLVRHWIDNWGIADARTTWLAAAVLIDDRPTRLLDQRLLPRAQRLLVELTETSEPRVPFYVSGSGALRPPPPVAAPLASSLRAPSRGDPPHEGGFARPYGLNTNNAIARTREVAPEVSAQRLRPGAAEHDLDEGGRGLVHPRPGAADHDDDDEEVAEIMVADEPGRPRSLEHPLPTEYAGLYFVLRLLQRLNIEAALQSNPDLIEIDLPVRILLRLAERLRIPDEDPVLLPLTPPAEDSTTDALVNDWVSASRRLCRRLSRMGLSELVRRPGKVQYTRTHIDLTFDLNAIDMRLRRAGLDFDPGWLQWLGRVVSFHYLSSEQAQ